MDEPASPLGSVRRWIWMRRVLWPLPSCISISAVPLMNMVNEIVRINDGVALVGIALLTLCGITISAWLHSMFTMRICAAAIYHPVDSLRPSFLRFFLFQLLIVPAVLALTVLLLLINLRPYV